MLCTVTDIRGDYAYVRYDDTGVVSEVAIACRAAIKAGDRTNAAEMLALAQRIMDGTVPPFCPHGRPCVLKITRKELEKQFGRLV